MTNLFDNLADEYDQWYEDNPLILQSEIEAIRQVTPPYRQALEVGVGTGRFASALGIGLGLEPSPPMAALAKARGITVVRGRAESLPFHDQSLDCLFMITVDCFLAQLAPVFSECLRVLEPGGHLVIGHIDIDAPPGEVYLREQDQDPFFREASFRGSRQVLEALDQAGFQVQTIRQTVYSFDNVIHPIKEGHGEGVFVALCALKP